MSSFLKVMGVGAVLYGAAVYFVNYTRVGRVLYTYSEQPTAFEPAEGMNLAVTVFDEGGPIHSVHMNTLEPITTNQMMAEVYAAAAHATLEAPDVMDNADIQAMVEEYLRDSE